MIARYHRPAEDVAAGEPEHGADHDDDRDQLEIVQDQRYSREAERLQGGDLLALGGNQPSQHHVEQERGDAEEDDGDGDRHRLLLVEFVFEKAI